MTNPLSYSHPTGCTCAACPPREPVTPEVIPGTPEHLLWSREQARKREAAEARFAETSAHRPAHSGLGTHLTGSKSK